MPPITKVLVANRGEIAIRIFRGCKDMGISTAAIYSEIDRDAPHVGFADEAHYLGGKTPASGYLDIARIVDVARECGADAVHPGYGFLAENAEFAAAVTDAGITWIGPPSGVIESMGDKVSARRTAASVGVEAVPGSKQPISGADEVNAFAETYGWPVTLKAAHGGGGRGFRIVRRPEEAAAAFQSAASEAQASFGNAEIYLERYLEAPRHIEVQILADSFGNVVHLGERDCSLQRRHQKLIEESPSPAVSADLRQRLCEAAVKIAEAAGYESAGTVEFLLEQSPEGPKFWFLEMNTRLQVEHPVTELVVGFDLVRQMIRIAEGNPLGFSQEDVALRGHAIECRLNAEDAAANFMPSPGVIVEYLEPGGPGVRVDSGAVPGSEIPESYDSLIGKLICWGADREEAIGRMLRALDEYRITGIRTTIPFHRFALTSDWFRAGDFSTQTVESSVDLSSLRSDPLAPSPPRDSVERVVTAEVEGKRYEVRFTEKLDPSKVRVKPAPPDLSGAGAGAATGETLTAPMRGTIVRVLVEEGDAVKSGDAILVLEAMKMENMILCHRDGVVKELKVSAGDTVSLGATLAEIEGD